MNTNTASMKHTVASVHRAQLTRRWLPPSALLVTVQGELDASNAQQFADYAVQPDGQAQRLILDLTGVDFFGTAGFSALHAVNVRCAGDGVDWAMVPSPAVSRLLRICDPDSTLPVSTSLQAALAIQLTQHRLLQLVSKTR